MIQKLYILILLLTFGFSECIVGNCVNGQGTLKIGIWFNDNFVEEKTFTEVIEHLKAKYPDSEILEGY